MYIINQALLEVGDIILERHNSGNQDLVSESRKIRSWINSEFSHAMLYVGNSSVIESNVEGVQSNNIQRKLYNEVTDVAIFRPKEKKTGFESKVIEYARRMCIQGYTDIDHKHTKQKPINPTEPNRQFCTRFVALAYNEADVKITNNPWFVNSRDIELSEKLLRIDNCLKIADKNEIEFATSDGIINKQADYNWQMLNDIRNAVEDQEIQTIENVIEFAIKKPEYDSIIADIVKKSEYYSMWIVYEKENPWEYDSNLMKEHYKEKANIAAMEYYISNIDVMKRFETTLMSLTRLYNSYKRNTISVFMDLYKNLITSCNKRIEVSIKTMR